MSAALRRLPRLLVIVAGALLLGLLAYGLLAQSPRTSIAEGLARGEPVRAPAFTLPVLERGELGPRLQTALRKPLADGSVALEELRGIPLVVNFWASWCDPCREEMPLVQQVWRDRARDAGVLVLGIDMQDIETDARGFLREFDADYLNLRDRGDDVAREYGVTGLPETFFIDRAGRAVGKVVGTLTAAELRDGIAAARSGTPLPAR